MKTGERAHISTHNSYNNKKSTLTFHPLNFPIPRQFFWLDQLCLILRLNFVLVWKRWFDCEEGQACENVFNNTNTTWTTLALRISTTRGCIHGQNSHSNCDWCSRTFHRWLLAFKSVTTKLFTNLQAKTDPNYWKAETKDFLDREGKVENVLCTTLLNQLRDSLKSHWVRYRKEWVSTVEDVVISSNNVCLYIP